MSARNSCADKWEGPLRKGEKAMEISRFIVKPNIEVLPGIRVTKDTVLDYENEYVEQHLKDLTFRSVVKQNGEIRGTAYNSTYETTIHLKEGDVLVWEEEGRGYIMPVQEVVSIAEAIEELECIKNL